MIDNAGDFLKWASVLGYFPGHGGGGGVTAAQVQTSAFNFNPDIGATNAFQVNLSPAVTSLTDGLLVTMLANNFNTSTAPTLQVNALTPVTIVNALGELAATDISTGGVYLFVYNAVGNNFELINPSVTNANAYLVQKNYFNYGPDIGSANAYEVNLPLLPLVTLAGGLSVILQVANTNTGASTLDVNGSSADIVGISGGALTGGELIGGEISEFVYSDNYSAWVLINTAIVPGTGTVNAGSANQLAYYISSGNAVSGLATANNALLTTNGSGVPAINNTIGADITVNNLTVGQGNYADGSNTNTAFGYITLHANSSGVNNTAIGYGAGQSIVNGSNNSIFGANAAQVNDGNDNLFFGTHVAESLGDIAYGNYNVIMGNTACNGGGNPGSTDLLAGDLNTILGYYASVSNTTTTGCIGIGAYSNVDAATGVSSSDWGPGIAFAASSNPVGFRGDGSALPGGDANYWRVKINDVYYNIPILPDGTSIQWPATGTLATTTTGQFWQDITTATETMVAGESYIADYASGTTVFTLPATAAVGTELRVKGGFNGSGWQILQGVGQQISVGNVSSTLGNTGYVQSTDATDSLSLVCLVADTIWGDFAVQGTIDLE